MTIIWLTIFIFLDLVIYLIIFDIILSWLILLWINFRPKFLRDIIDPIYNFINKLIPTTFWPLRFDALIAIFLIYWLQFLIINFIPWVYEKLNIITSSLW